MYEGSSQMQRKFRSNSEVDRLVSASYWGDDGKMYIDHSDENIVLDLIKALEKVCESLIKTKEIVFSSKDGKRLLSCSEAGKALLKIFERDELAYIEDAFPECRLNPLLKIALDVIGEENAAYYVRQLRFAQINVKRTVEYVVEMLNRLVKTIREKMGSEDNRRDLRNYQRGANKNRKALHRFVDAIFKCHAKVLVVRLDLSYKKPLARPLDQRNISHDDVGKHLKTLLKDIKNKLFKKNFITYAWKLEYGLIKGYHYHIFFFFKGAKVEHDTVLGNMIATHWERVITKGSGGHFNCNKFKKNYPYNGIGLIDHRDTGKIDILKTKAMEYIMEVDYYVRTIAGDAIRTFGKGATPKPPETPQGRPRFLTNSDFIPTKKAALNCKRPTQATSATAW